LEGACLKERVVKYMTQALITIVRQRNEAAELSLILKPNDCTFFVKIS